MGEFIRLDIDRNRCLGTDTCGKCIEVCPVNIFVSRADYPETVNTSEDECTLCELCLKACEPDAIALHKLYEE